MANADVQKSSISGLPTLGRGISGHRAVYMRFYKALHCKDKLYIPEASSSQVNSSGLDKVEVSVKIDTSS